MLLKEIAGDGKGLWAVADLRQSIYRWRGASPANLWLFGEDFPNGEIVSLENNYRSKDEIVRLFANFAKQMKAADAGVFSDWQTGRAFENFGNQTAAINLEIADSIETEAANLADRISAHRAAELAYKDCAVICRTHNQLNKFAQILTAKGVPIFYLGELFEREEVRDLLALLDLKYSANGHSLMRVAEFPEYDIPLADVKIVIEQIKENQTAFDEILEDDAVAEKLSAVGAKGWNILREHLRKFPIEMSAWQFLAIYLFVESDYLKSSFAAKNVHNQSRLLAIYQLLRLAQMVEAKFANTREKQIPEFLAYVKKLALFNEDKNYAQIPAAAENLDAVRLLTVHSAKGLEFRAVFLPYLGAGKIPSNRKGQTCPNPNGMIANEADFHDEEEECLFFVAMSRARDFLHLSRSDYYGETKSNESKFLTALAEFTPTARRIESEDSSLVELANDSAKSFPPKTFYSGDLDRYLRCPRDYFYTVVCGLKSKDEQTIYLKFHSCIYDTISSLQTMRQIGGIEFTVEAALNRLGEFWQAAEIDAHAYAPVYKQRAEEIIRRMCRRIENADAEILRPTFKVKLSNGAVRVRLDAVEITEIAGEKTAVVRKYKTGKQPKKPATDDADSLLMRAAKEQFPDAAPLLRKIYLSDDTEQDQSVSEKVIKSRLEKYERAIDGINLQNFPAAPNGDNCPRCQHFFNCPSGNQKKFQSF